MTRPAASDWSVLGLSTDPVPGDPQAFQDIIQSYRTFADTAQQAHDLLASGSRIDDGQGKSMEAFRNTLGQLPYKLDQMAQSYQGAIDAYNRYLPSLEEAQSMSLRALDQARQASQEQTTANAALSAAHHTLNTLQDDPNPDPAQQQSATSDVSAAQSRLDDSQQLLDQAKSLLGQATALRDQAASAAAQTLYGLADGAPQESIWQKIVQAFKDFFHFLASTIVQWITTALDAIAAIASFIFPPLGDAIGLLSGAIQLVGAVASGNKTAIGMAAAGIGLAFVPGGRLVADVGRLAAKDGQTLAGTVKNGIKDTTSGLAAGAGKTIGGKIGGKSGGDNTRGLEASNDDPAKNSKTNDSTPCTNDPIDLTTGRVVLDQKDIELGGALPMVFTRSHRSDLTVGRWFGPTWSSTVDQRIEIGPTGVHFLAADGMLLSYPVPLDGPVLPVHGTPWPLSRGGDGEFTITDYDAGHTLHFTPTGTNVLPITALTDRNGNRIDFVYTDTGIPSEIRHSGGYRIAVDTGDGLITALRLLDGTDDGVVLWRYGYNDDRRLTEIVNPDDHFTVFTYDSAGRLTRWDDTNGMWYRYIYDSDGRCVEAQGRDGYADCTLEFDTANSVTRHTDSLGHTTTYQLNEHGQVILEIDPLGNEIRSEWDIHHRLLYRTDPLGRVTRYEYDEGGNLIAMTRPDGSQTRYEYNESGLPVTITAPDGTIWRRSYDRRNNLTAVTDPTGAVTRYAYDVYGHLRETTDALGHIRRVQTNTAGLPVAVTDTLGATTHYERDGLGRVTAITDPAGGVTRFGWAPEDKLAWCTLPDGATERWMYDGEGNLRTSIDALGQTTHAEVTNFDLPAAESGPNGSRLEFGYDTELRMGRGADERGRGRRYGDDPTGNVLREHDFNDRVISYSYDAAGQLIERTNGAGEVTRFTYDVLGNVIERRSGGTIATFSYDPLGRLLEAKDSDAQVSWRYDHAGRVLAETINGRIVASAYDELGRRTHRRTPSGAESIWEYDTEDQPVALHTAGRTLRFDYDPAGREIKRVMGTNAALAQSWDTNNQLLSQTVTGSGGRRVQQRSYMYRPDGQLIGIHDQLTGPRTFDLDPVGQVTSVHGPEWVENYVYDTAGNVTSATWLTPADSPNVEVQGEREYNGTLIRRAGNIHYRHDAQGRAVTRQQDRSSGRIATWRYFWDANDRLTQVLTPDGAFWRYRYDPLGRRVAKQRLTADGRDVLEEIDFTWDGPVLVEQAHRHRLSDTAAVLGDPTVTVWDYEPGTFYPVTQYDLVPRPNAPRQWVDESFHAVVTDLIGTPTELINEQGDIAWHAQSTLWGVEVSERGATTALRFPGQYFDPETQLHYNLHRYYDPRTARYASNDPLGLDAGPNPQAYVTNPTGWIDPLGLRTCRKRSAGWSNRGSRATGRRGNRRPSRWTAGGGRSWDSTQGGLFPLGGNVVYAGLHRRTQQFSQRFVRESEHPLPTQSVRDSGIATRGAAYEPTISIPYRVHRGTLGGGVGGRGVTSTGSGEVPTQWRAQIANMLRAGDNYGAIRAVTIDELNTNIDSARGMLTVIDEYERMGRLTSAQAGDLKNEVADTYWRRQGRP